jgi:hypothetical protein
VVQRTVQLAKPAPPALVEPVVEPKSEVQPRLRHPLTIEHPAVGYYRNFSGNVVSPQQGDVDDDDYWHATRSHMK